MNMGIVEAGEIISSPTSEAWVRFDMRSDKEVRLWQAHRILPFTGVGWGQISRRGQRHGTRFPAFLRSPVRSPRQESSMVVIHRSFFAGLCRQIPESVERPDGLRPAPDRLESDRARNVTVGGPWRIAQHLQSPRTRTGVSALTSHPAC